MATSLGGSSSDDALIIHGISKRYAHHVAVRDLSLRVPRGAVYGLLGPNGAGKTSTIRMVLNIMAPDTGTITVLGHSSTDPTITDRLGYLPEERGLYRKMRVRDVLRFLGKLKGLPADGLDRTINDWLERFALRGAGGEDWSAARVDELSRGMQQKVQFIGALMHDPELVVLDEPFSGLDPVNAQALKDTVESLRTRGRTVIFSTHVMENAERMCDAVCIIARGEKVLDGPVAEVRAQHGTRLVALTFAETPSVAVQELLRDPALVVLANTTGHTTTPAIPHADARIQEVELAEGVTGEQLLGRLVAVHAPLERFELVRPSLHRIFLERVGAAGVETGVSGHG